MEDRTLDLTISVRENEFFIITEDLESGDSQTFGPYAYDEKDRFDAEIGNEIYSWVQIARERLEEEDG